SDAAREEGLRAVAAAPAALTARVAVATKGGGTVNEHFGHARELQVYEVSARGAAFVGHRKVEHYCRGGDGDDDAMTGLLAAISDCAAVLVARVGRCPKEQLAAAGVEPVDAYAHQFIEPAALAWFQGFAARVAAGEVTPERRAEPVPVAAPAGPAATGDGAAAVA
ncbi:MAG TPA: NifB/NifX family molybdenum-iron cluster-binding protein, partial [Anaeromyxobacteraceae bacterium]|nr:NifB/NifX family molybdenum-iron cluster-binding protein [Anaeromyxobacteraceae bacterium]